MEEAFGIDPKLAWQVHRIATAINPLAVGMHVPARVSVKRLLAAAGRRRVPAAVVERVSGAFEDFERFVQQHAEDRAGLEAMVSAHLPESRERAELAAKQAAFKAMSQIRGIAMDAAVQAFIRHPSADGKGVDMASVEAYLGLRRLSPEARIGFVTAVAGQPGDKPVTLDGRPIEGPESILLAEFSSSPLPRIEVEVVDGATHHWVVGRDVGLRGAVDLVSAWTHPGRGRRVALPGEPTRTGAVCAIDTPMKRLTFDVFVHRDLYPGSTPELMIYHLGMHGHVRFFGDPSREADRLHMHEAVRSLGSGLTGARLSHVPRYAEVLACAYERLGWSPGEFRGYRLDVQFPVHGAQYVMGFQLPQVPA